MAKIELLEFLHVRPSVRISQACQKLLDVYWLKLLKKYRVFVEPSIFRHEPRRLLTDNSSTFHGHLWENGNGRSTLKKHESAKGRPRSKMLAKYATGVYKCAKSQRSRPFHIRNRGTVADYASCVPASVELVTV
ncbi:hypothetical protein EVAR_23251_1 [Eumeta japonica]|uniref:Uncharacterized protein n=1 Tax=Eumeta variegata TaxID=151549 RepID=A0A4C1V838_EUMVA|nr:hypothetical protein EVAR_23251_1 [Eumeta japonica]